VFYGVIRYLTVGSDHQSDSFHVIARFTHVPTKKSELAIADGDIFHVVDSLPEEGELEFWMARKMKTGTSGVEQAGLIPNVLKVGATLYTI